MRIARSTALSVRRILTAEERPALAALRSALEDGREVWGVERACSILRALDGNPPLRRALGSAAQVDEEVVGIVQSHLFDFGDLIRLRDTELQALLGACDNTNLARALFDSGEPILLDAYLYKNLDKIVYFYTRLLGMRELRQAEYPGGKFTNTFVNYDDGADGTVLDGEFDLVFVPSAPSAHRR